MTQAIIKPLAKGQITIPAVFRKALQVTDSTLFKAELKEEGILLKPFNLDWKEKYIREFSEDDILSWLKEDKLDAKTLKKIKKYLT